MATPRHALARRAVAPVRSRMEKIHSDLMEGALHEAFSQWLLLGLMDKDVAVGRNPARRSQSRTNEESGWPPSLVFALEVALAEWTLGRACSRLQIPSDHLERLIEDLPLAAADISWPDKVLELDAESRFLPHDSTALVSALYHRLLPRPVRHDLGVYHTPSSLARFVVDRVWDLSVGEDVRTWMDPSCGFGVFLVVLARRMGPSWPGRLLGRDVSPLAVLQSRAALLEVSCLEFGMDEEQALDHVLDAVRIEDVLFAPRESEPTVPVDALVGNPPWVTWDRLVPPYRERIKKLVAHRPYLYEKGGFSLLLGGSTDDISALFTALAAERYLREEGLVGLLLKRSLLTNETGSWFRALEVADPSVRLSMLQVEDLSRCKGLFGKGGQQTMAFLARKGGPGSEPIQVGIWQRQGRRVLLSHRAVARRMDPSLPGSPWRLEGRLSGQGGGSEGSRGASDRTLPRQWAYASQIHHGLKHDAEDLFVFTRIEDLGRGMVRAWPKRGDMPVTLETGRLFRYAKPRHVQAWRLRGWEYVLVPQDRAGTHDQDLFAAEFPASFAYLRSHAERLAARRSRVFESGPFYGMFGLGPYTWDRYRLLWSGLGYRPLFCPALAEPDPLLGDAPILPDSGCYSLSVPDEVELWYLVGLLNSRPARRAIQAVALGSKRPLSKTAMSRLDLPQFDASREDMGRLAQCARQTWYRMSAPGLGVGQSGETMAGGKEIDQLAEEIDRLVESMLQG